MHLIKKRKGQERMLELIASLVFISFLLVFLQFFIFKYYSHKIDLLNQETSYEKAIKIYRAIAGDQVFSRSSMETGYLDQSKLSAIMRMYDDEDKVCDYVSQFFGFSTYIEIENLEKYTNVECTHDKFSECGKWVFCRRNKREMKSYYDMFITLYNPLDEKTYIGYVRIGV